MDAKVSITYLNGESKKTTNLSKLDPSQCEDMAAVKTFISSKLNKIKNGDPKTYSRYVGETAEYVAD